MRKKRSCFFEDCDWKGRLFVYLLLVITLYLSIEILCSFLDVDGFNQVSRKIRKVIDAMLLALPLFYIRKKCILFPYLLLVNLYLLSIACYFSVYGTIMPLQSYLMVTNLNGLGANIVDVISSKNLLVIFPTACFVVFYVVYGQQIVVRYSTKRLLCSLICFLLILGTVLPLYFIRDPEKKPFYLFSVVGNRAFKQFGIINFWIYQIHPLQKVSLEEEQYAKDFMKNHKSNFFPCDSLVGHKNLILILVESLESWPINLRVGRTEVTPYINSLVKEPNSLYFPKVLPQVRDGRSSDAQLLINAGLLPLNTGAASSLCAQNMFYSLPKALKEKGYQSVSLLCDVKSFWNQEATTMAYGFDKLYDRLSDDGAKETADSILFSQSLKILQELKPPFYAQLVTYSSHSPYTAPLVESSLQQANLNDKIKYYLIALEYVDRCISTFIEGLKQNDLYDNSIIVIMGDHNDPGLNSYENREARISDRFVPFIIVNSPLSAEMDCVMGQVDIYPSLLNLMGVCDYPFRGLGQSVFNHEMDSCAVLCNGEAAGRQDSFAIARKQQLWKVSDILLRMDYFKKNSLR